MLVWGQVGATYSQLAMAVLMEVECALTQPGKGFGGLGPAPIFSSWVVLKIMGPFWF